MRYRGVGSCARVLAVAAVVVLGVSAGSARAVTQWPVPSPSQSQWFNYDKDLKDPTTNYVQKVPCDSFTPSGQATLYPYNVPEGPDVPYYRWAYRNNSTSGVVVSPNTAFTGIDNLAFNVMSLHISGDYAFKVSIQCQSIFPDANSTIGTPTVTDITPTSAQIHAAFGYGITPIGGLMYSWYVQYGTKTAVYDQQTTPVAVTLPNSGVTNQSITLSGLTPNTVYHFRVALKFGAGGSVSYSGADQQFSTGTALGGRRTAASPLVTIAPAGAPRLRLTGPGRARRQVVLRRPTGSPEQYWTITNPGSGSRTTLVNARTGLCLAAGGTPPATAAVADRCRAGARRQQWQRVRSGNGGWRLRNAQSRRLLAARPGGGPVLVARASTAAGVTWRTVSVRGRR